MAVRGFMQCSVLYARGTHSLAYPAASEPRPSYPHRGALFQILIYFGFEASLIASLTPRTTNLGLY